MKVLGRQVKLSIPAMVVLAFAGFIALGFLFAYVRSQLPSHSESCWSECSAKNLSARLVPEYPKHMLPDAKNPPVVCECY